MAEPSDLLNSARLSPHLPSTAVKPAAQAAEASSVRSRGRRQGGDGNGSGNTNGNGDKGRGRGQPIRKRDPGLLAVHHPLESRSGSRASSRGAGVSPNREAGAGAVGGGLGQFLGDSWSQSWSSVQSIAASIIAVGEEQIGAVGRSQAGKNRSPGPIFNPWGRDRSESHKSTSRGSGTWGPAPPSQNPGINDVAAGSSAHREAALKAARTASVLESHDGVNGGLDITGNYKRRNSNEVARAPTQPEEYLVYIHKVQPSDTHAGLTLRYKCRGDALKKANGLWSNDSIQMRKWLTFPVDACELRGRPCAAPSHHKIPAERGTNTIHEDPLSQPDAVFERAEADKDMPWTHVKWVQIDSFPEPVEIGRVARQAMGYFPPRRKRSGTTSSSISASTPRQGADISRPAMGLAGPATSRRQSSPSASGLMKLPGGPSSSRDGDAGASGGLLPAWMRRPGGVGSMGRNARTPGPEKDSLNTWMEKHLPSLNIDDLPSMSVMGSETASLGFAHSSAGIVEASFEQGQDAAVPESSQGIGFDRAATAVETWLRGALARNPSSPLMSSMRGKLSSQDEDEGDLIELSDTPGDSDFRLSSSTDQGDGDSQSRANTSQRDMPRPRPRPEGFRSRKNE